jgi:peptide/nickel transport system permease protein
MSTGAIQNPATMTPEYLAEPPGNGPAETPQGFWARAWADTFRNKRAKVSAVWILALVFFAVFAPFVANSHPLLLKEGGKWSSPLLRHLTAPDVILLVTFFAGVTLLRLRRVRYRFLIFVGIVVLASIACGWSKSPLHVSPPPVVVYSQYREDTKAGKVQYALYTIIRFSPTDRLWGKRLDPPDRWHWFGLDANGADVLSRTLHASRIALSIGFIATSIEMVIGILVGGIMGYFAGYIDLLGMRLIEIFEAIPTLFLLITFTAFYERNLYMIMAIIGLTGWTGNARFIRGEFLRLRNQDFVQAAKAAGLPLWSILFRHMLPNGVTPVLVSASFGVASAILLESTLSFLGLGLVEEPSWGGMLEQARSAGHFVWWLAVYPGMAIFLTVFAYNLIGESMRDALDPKLRGIE